MPPEVMRSEVPTHSIPWPFHIALAAAYGDRKEKFLWINPWVTENVSRALATCMVHLLFDSVDHNGSMP